MVRVALEERVAAVAYSFVDSTPYVAPAHAVGTKVLVQVQTVVQARTAAATGADAIAAQGSEGGRHTGTHGTLSFVLPVVDAVGEIPVVAAGGIADGRGLAAVLLLGAESSGRRGSWQRAPTIRSGRGPTTWG